MTAINRGTFTVLLAALNIILFFGQPGKFYFMLALLISDKVYMNSMLAMWVTQYSPVRRPIARQHTRGTHLYVQICSQEQNYPDSSVARSVVVEMDVNAQREL
ncbi:hypothetical protein B0H14DRAFT_2571233 [Mycena olivaceomarginata]|nr:hypothetical protein B0H14DRAFT_2571233 [Mycena olivaceomarginata]